MLACEVPLFAAQAGDGDGALPLQKQPDHRGHRVLGWNRDTHVHVVRHQVTLYDLALLLPGQRVEDRTQLPTRLTENGFASSRGHEHVVVLATSDITSSPCEFTKPLGEDFTPGMVKPLRVSLVDPVAYPLSYQSRTECLPVSSSRPTS